METLVNEDSFWKNRRVLITGQSGFKGAWLSLWLESLGAQVSGYSLAPPSQPNLFDSAEVARGTVAINGDLRDLAALKTALNNHQPEVIFHLAAQALVRRSYNDPVETFETNVQGTVHLLEAARQAESVKAIVVVTSDKCYENKEWPWAYRENDPMGGHDPYSASKGCAELVVAAYRRSFLAEAGILVASVRAGNVIGGGDWGEDRLVPDAVQAFARNETLQLRNPGAYRPWQHVLEPLRGYLMLARRLIEGDETCARALNFGPNAADARSVGHLVNTLSRLWGGNSDWSYCEDHSKHEANMLRLDNSLAQNLLGWHPSLTLDEALAWTVEWYQAHASGNSDMRDLCLQQIRRYQAACLTPSTPQPPSTTPNNA